MVDYYGSGVVTVLIFYLCRQIPHGWIGEVAGLAFLNCKLLGGMTIPLTLGSWTLEFPEQGLRAMASSFKVRLSRHPLVFVCSIVCFPLQCFLCFSVCKMPVRTYIGLLLVNSPFSVGYGSTHRAMLYPMSSKIG